MLQTLALIALAVGPLPRLPQAPLVQSTRRAVPEKRLDETPPNVIVVLLDDVGLELLRLYDDENGYDGSTDALADGLYPRTPNLDALAARGVTFTNAYATPNCSPGRAALLTGCYPARTGVGNLVRWDQVGGLAEFGDPGFDLPTLPEVLRPAGYVSAIVGKWHLGLPTRAMDPVHGDDAWLGWDGIAQRGHFDEVRCTWANVHLRPYPPGLPGGYYNYFWFVNGTAVPMTGTYLTTHQFDEALGFATSASEPFFLFVSPNAAHAPFVDLPPAELVNTPEYVQGPPTVIRNYAAILEALDTKLGDLVQGLGPELARRTLILVMGDNGTEAPVVRSLREDTGFDLGPSYDARIDDGEPRFKHAVYEGGVRVPLIAAWSGIDAPGRKSAALVDIVDLLPTVAEVAGVAPGDVDGVSFLPVLRDASVSAAEHARQWTRAERFMANGPADTASVIHEFGFGMRLPDGRRFKLVRHSDLEARVVRDELYLLSDASGAPVDRFELRPLPTAPGSVYREVYLTLAAAMLPPEVESYCAATPNSTGVPARLSHEGVPSATLNDLYLEVRELPPGALGALFYGSTAIALPFGNGVRCVGGGVFRVGLGAADSGGLLRLRHDLELPVAAAGEVHPGSTWKYQAWYRDPAGGSAAFNTSDALSVRFSL